MPLIFNALSGPELKKAVLAEIERKLDATGEFPQHITFPWVKFSFEVSFVAYPKQSASDPNPGIVAKGEVESGTLPSTEDHPEPAHHFEVKETLIIDTPDLARLSSNQPLPTTAPGPGGVLVDKPVTPAAPDPGRKPFGYRGKGDKSGTGSQSAS